jgi:hypothetical protein
MASARGPESRTIATLPWPGAMAVAMAAMVSVACRGRPGAAPHSQRGTPTPDGPGGAAQEFVSPGNTIRSM